MNFIQTLAISALPIIFAITLHEAAHGYAARHFGDPTAWQMGRISLNPLRHVDWNEPTSIFNSVVLPLLTTIMLGFPMGMAWVPVGVLAAAATVLANRGWPGNGRAWSGMMLTSRTAAAR